jgi:tetratricopeptide (TPR) repeat protein
MKLFAVLGLLLALVLVSPVRAQQAADDSYLTIYSVIEQADGMGAPEQANAALAKYVQAQSDLQRFQKIYPEWNPKIIEFRLSYLADKISDLTPQVNLAVAPPTNAPASNAEWESQLGTLRQQVQALRADNTTLQVKLKEALSEQPAVIDSRELDRAQDRITSLTKENDLLKASLAGTPPNANQLTQAAQALSEANRKLADEMARVDKLSQDNSMLQGRLDTLATRPGTMEAVRDENAQLKKQLADLKAATNSVVDQFSAELNRTKAQIAVFQSDAQVALLEKAALEARMRQMQATNRTAASQDESEARIKALMEERNNLLQRLGEANVELYGRKKQDAAAQINNLSDQVNALRARLAVDEAQVIPYSPEELALFQQAEPKLANPDAEKKSMSELPSGSAALVAEAEKHFAAREYDQAEGDYLQILRRDPDNALVAANLATIEMQQGKLDAASRHLQTAITQNPNDAYNLSMLGYLKFQQGSYDAALDALSRAARLDPQNPEIENYLGVTLGHKGLRAQAETALRKALQLDPNFAPAHNNLAVIYVNQQPPLAELARWHYQKSLELGQPRNPELEKVLADKGAPVNQ